MASAIVANNGMESDHNSLVNSPEQCSLSSPRLAFSRTASCLAYQNVNRAASVSAFIMPGCLPRQGARQPPFVSSLSEQSTSFRSFMVKQRQLKRFPRLPKARIVHEAVSWFSPTQTTPSSGHSLRPWIRQLFSGEFFHKRSEKWLTCCATDPTKLSSRELIAMSRWIETNSN